MTQILLSAAMIALFSMAEFLHASSGGEPLSKRESYQKETPPAKPKIRVAETPGTVSLAGPHGTATSAAAATLAQQRSEELVRLSRMGTQDRPSTPLSSVTGAIAKTGMESADSFLMLISRAPEYIAVLHSKLSSVDQKIQKREGKKYETELKRLEALSNTINADPTPLRVGIKSMGGSWRVHQGILENLRVTRDTAYPPGAQIPKTLVEFKAEVKKHPDLEKLISAYETLSTSPTKKKIREDLEKSRTYLTGLGVTLDARFSNRLTVYLKDLEEKVDVYDMIHKGLLERESHHASASPMASSAEPFLHHSSQPIPAAPQSRTTEDLQINFQGLLGSFDKVVEVMITMTQEEISKLRAKGQPKPKDPAAALIMNLQAFASEVTDLRKTVSSMKQHLEVVIQKIVAERNRLYPPGSTVPPYQDFVKAVETHHSELKKFVDGYHETFEQMQEAIKNGVKTLRSKAANLSLNVQALDDSLGYLRRFTEGSESEYLSNPLVAVWTGATLHAKSGAGILSPLATQGGGQ